MSPDLSGFSFRKHFEAGDEAFYALNSAEAFARDAGYSTGSLQASAPMALFRGDCLVSKWRNLSPSERGRVDGMIVEGRDGFRADVTLHLRTAPDSAAREGG